MEIQNTDNFTECLAFFHVIGSYSEASRYKPEYFSSERLQKLFKIIQPYIMQYQEEPSKDQVILLIKAEGFDTEITADIIDTLWSIKPSLSQYSDEWLEEVVKSLGEWNSFLTAVKKMYSYLMINSQNVTLEQTHSYIEKVKTMFTADTQFNFNDSIGHDFFDPQSHKQAVSDGASSGYKFIDMCLSSSGLGGTGSGFSRGTLNVIMGAPKAGKSIWLCNLCANSVLAGHNSAYISLEMSVAIVNKRIGSNIFNIPMGDYDRAAADENYMREKIRNVYNSSFTTPGTLVVEEFPTSSATVYDIESFLLNAEKARSTVDKPFKFRNVFIDYVNIMGDARHGNSAETYMKIKGICEDVRAMAQRNNWCVISVTQINRAGQNASDVDMTNVSESSGLVATVDSLFGIISTTMMKAENIYYLKAVALRNSPRMGDKKKFNFQGEYMRIREDETEDIIPEAVSLPKTLTMGAPDNRTGDNNGGWGPRKNNQEGQQQYVPQAPVQQLSTGAPSLGVTDLNLSKYDLFQ